MGRRPGSVNRPKVSAESVIVAAPTLEQAIDVLNTPADAEPVTSEADEVSRIKFCESRRIWGIIPTVGARYVTLVRRNYYEEETIVTKGRGGPRTYAAGSYGPWRMTDACFPSTIESALEKVADMVQNEFLDRDEADDIRNVVAHIRAVKADLIREIREHFGE